MTIDPIRTAGGGPGALDISSEINTMRSPRQSSLFSRAIVQEYLGDLSRRSRSELESLAASVVGGITELARAPRNSVLATPVFGPGSALTTQKILCYPFFPPHLSMPVKPGEQVWMIQDGTRIGYWFCRVTESNFIDDVNYTHSDRKFSVYIDKSRTQTLSIRDTQGEQTQTYDGLKDDNKIPGPPSFPFGADFDTDDSVINITGLDSNDPGASINPYDIIYTGSFAMQSFVLEPVPRFTKRPGDLVVQGSNNTLICLGQDRGWTAAQRPDTASHSNAYSDVSESGTPIQPISEFCGTIDIVSGRGRFFGQDLPNPDNTNIKDTQPRVIKNTRGKLEIDKNPASYTSDAQRSSIESNRKDRPQEGDPDFLTDASRVYVSMRTSGDVNFNVTPDRIYPPFEGELSSVVDSPFIVMKSDEVRIIARKETERGTVNGSIRLIKEGDVNGDMASIYMMPSGIVQISGAKVYIGQPDQGVGPAEKKSEPYVKYSELEKLLTTTYDAVDKFCQTLLTHTTPGYGSPSPQIIKGATELQTEVLKKKQEIVNLKSTRIFGE